MQSIPENAIVLVVDDDPGLLLSISATLASSGLPEPAILSDSRQAMDIIRSHNFHLILLDLKMPFVSGMALLEEIKTELPHIECVIVTASDEASTAIQAMRFGAYDYLVKPLNTEKLILTVNRALERFNLRNELTLYEKKQRFSDLEHPQAFARVIARDESMALVFRQAEVVAPTDYNVFITGESGTGKELLASVIHDLSNRARAPFVAVNMASFNKSLFEDEFFGHIKGAYTDAFSDKKGFFEQAKGGTLFLDEITELEPSLQAKVLRVIEERELYRLGSTTVRNVDVRIISASNRNIEEEIRNKNFRADLFYRLNMFNIKLPPLRQRKEDILPLARHFLAVYAARNNKPIQSIDTELANRLLQYDFPGNVRELENIIAAAVLLEPGGVLQLASAPILQNLPERRENRRRDDLISLAELEKGHITRVLRAVGGNRTQAARILGVNATTVYRKIEKYRISDELIQPNPADRP